MDLAAANQPWAITSTGVDYITATASEPRHVAVLVAIGRSLCDAASKRGDEQEPWSWQGYQGRTSPQASYGLRQDGMIIRLSGTTAQEKWHELVPLAAKVSRLDLQVTVRRDAYEGSLAQDGRRTAILHQAGEGRPPRITLILGHPRGDTLYIGSRSSDRFGRVYDKHESSPTDHPPGTWRYEVESKREVARLLARTILGSRDRERAIQSYVHNWFNMRGVPPVWDSETLYQERAPTRPTTTETRLAWLRSSVAPLIRRMEAKIGREAVLEALGLDTPRRPSGMQWIDHPDKGD